MEVNSELKKAYEQLLLQDDFFTRSALQTIYNRPQSIELSCPPTYIFILNNALQSNQALSSFINTVPENKKSQVQSILHEFLEVKQEMQVGNSFFNNLRDVKWQMSIQNGRQVYEVQLFTSEKSQPFKMKLSYEQLSILSFQVSQVVTTINQKIDRSI